MTHFASSFSIGITLISQRCFDVGQNRGRRRIGIKTALGQPLMIAGYSNLSQQ